MADPPGRCHGFYPVDDVNDKATHFMGAVVTMPARSVPVGVSKFLIIDGQQRLTTISVLMCAVRDMLSPEQQGARRRIQQFYLTNDGSEGTEFFKLLPTQGDRTAYASLIQEAGTPMVESQFKKAYDYFRRRLRGESDDGEKIEPKRLLDIIEKRLMVVMINLSETDDPYLIFESLNFKGSPLEQSDLVRNYFLMRFPASDQQGVYDGLWLPMQNRLGQGLTEFMRHFLGAEGEEVRKGDVYTAVRRLVTDSDSASVRILMTRMERLSTLYSRLSGVAGESHPELLNTSTIFDDSISEASIRSCLRFTRITQTASSLWGSSFPVWEYFSRSSCAGWSSECPRIHYPACSSRFVSLSR
jgi:hypothetical protein